MTHTHIHTHPTHILLTQPTYTHHYYPQHSHMACWICTHHSVLIRQLATLVKPYRMLKRVL